MQRISKAIVMLVKLVLDQKEINQLQELRIAQDGPMWPNPINPFVSLQAVEQVHFGISHSQGQICTLLLELVQKEAAWHVLTGPCLAAPSPQNAVAGFIYTSREV